MPNFIFDWLGIFGGGSSPSNTSFGPVDIKFSTSAAAGGAPTSQSVAVDGTNTLGNTTGFLELQIDAATAGQGIVQTIEFDTPFPNTGVTNVSFDILDVDQDTFDDQVRIIAYDPAGNVLPSNVVTLTAPPTVAISGDSANGNATAAPSDLSGNVSVSIAAEIGKIDIIFTAGPDVIGDPTSQEIGIGPISYSSNAIFDDRPDETPAPADAADDGMITGTAEDDIIFGGTIADGGFISGSNTGADNDATTPNDTITGEGGNDTIFAGAGDDSVLGGMGNDSIHGGTGNNILNGDGGEDTIFGGDMADIIDGGDERDFIFSGAGADEIRAGGGNDMVTESAADVAGNILIDGGTGSDQFEIAPGGVSSASLTGVTFQNFEFLSIDRDTTNFTVELLASQADDLNAVFLSGFETNTRTIDISMGDQTTLDLFGLGVSNFRAGDAFRVFGDGDAETISGTFVADSISGAGGDDSLTGHGGSDTILGGGGNDTLNGGFGADLLDGGTENDEINGDEGDDTIIASIGDDTIDGGADTDTYNSGNATQTRLDVNRAEDAQARLNFLTGTLTFDTITGVERFSAGERLGANDQFFTSSRIAAEDVGTQVQGISDTAVGEFTPLGGTAIAFGPGETYQISNILEGTSPGGGAAVIGPVGSYRITSGDENGQIGNIAYENFEEIRFTVEASQPGVVDGRETGENMGVGYFDPQGDQITTGDDSILGNGGNDTIDGRSGNDTIDGGDGNDTVNGSEGDDTFIASAGDNVIDGGADKDTYDGSGIERTLVITSDDGNGRVFTSFATGPTGDDTVSGIEHFIAPESASSDDSIALTTVIPATAISTSIQGLSDAAAGAFLSESGVPTSFGPTQTYQLSHILSGTSPDGASPAVGPVGFYRVSSGEESGQIGNISFENFETIEFEVEDLTDGVVDGLDTDELMESGYTDAQGDQITAGADSVLGNGGNDTIDGDGGNDTIEGGAGNDLVDGGAGSDDLDGGIGDDTIIGSTGGDAIDGGADTDTYDGSAIATMRLSVNNDGDGGLSKLFSSGAPGNDSISSVETYIAGEDSSESDRIALSDAIDQADVATAIQGLDDTAAGVFVSGDTGTAFGPAEDYDLSDILAGTSPDGILPAIGPVGRYNVTAGDESGQIGNISFENFENIVFSVRASPDGVVNGLDATETMALGYTDAQGDQITTGADSILGNGGNDIIDGAGGADTVSGGGGNDRLFLRVSEAADLAEFDGGADDDAISIRVDVPTGVVDLTGANISNVESLAIQTNFTSDLTIELTAAQANANFTSYTSALHQTSGASDATPFSHTYAFEMGGETTLDLSGVTFGGFINPGDKTVITGDADNETIIGGSLPDVIDGGGGNDNLSGGPGNDTIVASTGSDTIDGGADSNTYDSGSFSSVTVSARADESGRVSKFSGTSFVASDTLTSIQNYVAGEDASEDDAIGLPTILADEVGTSVQGLSDDAVGIFGPPGAPSIRFGPTETYQLSHILTGSSPDGVLPAIGPVGQISVTAGDESGQVGGISFENFELIEFSVSPETNGTVDGNSTSELMEPGFTDAQGDQITAGADSILGNGGNDTIDGGDGADTVDGGAGADSIDGGSGADILDGGTESDEINGDEGDDTIIASSGNDTIDGGADSNTYDTSGLSSVTVSTRVGEAGVVSKFSGTNSIGSDSLTSIQNYVAGEDASEDDAIGFRPVLADEVGTSIQGLSDDAVGSFGPPATPPTAFGPTEAYQLSHILSGTSPGGVLPAIGPVGFYSVTAGDESGQIGGISFENFELIEFSVAAPMNSDPDAMDDTADISEDAVATAIDVLDNDADPNPADTLSIQSFDTTGTAGGTVTLHDNGTPGDPTDDLLNYDPNGQFESLGEGDTATDMFSYTVTDSNGGTGTATVTVTIMGENDAPVASDVSISVGEDNMSTNIIPIIGSAANDPDLTDTLEVPDVIKPDTIGFATTSGVTDVSYNANGQFEYLADGETAADSFMYIVTDDFGGRETATVNVTITGVNDDPDAMDDSATVGENDPTPTTIDLTGNDADPDATDDLEILSIDTTGTLGIVTLNPDNDTVEYNPDFRFDDVGAAETATDTFTYTVTDGAGGQDTATVTVTVNGANDEPFAMDDVATVNEDAAATTINVLSNDTDVDMNDALGILSVDDTGVTGTVTVDDNGTPGDAADDTLLYDPNGQFEFLAEGEASGDSFTYTVTDGNGGQSTARVIVNVTGVNDDPDAMDDSATVGENDPTPTTIDLTGNDADPDATDDLEILSIDTTGTLGIVTLNPDNDTVEYNPDFRFDDVGAAETATDTFTYTVTDGAGGQDTATVTVTVNGANDEPFAMDDVATVNEDAAATTINVLSNDTDVDMNDALGILSVDDTGVTGTVTVDDNGTPGDTADDTLLYDPNGQFEFLAEGEASGDSFTYTVTDGNGGQSTARVIVNVTGVNDDPDAMDDSATVGENDPTPTTIDLTGNDADPDATDDLEILSIDTTGTLGIVTLNPDNDTVEYNPDFRFDDVGAAETATDTFTYTVTDGAGGQDTATVTVTVNGANDEPFAMDDVATVNEDAAATTINVLSNDTDVDMNDALGILSVDDTGVTGTVTVDDNGTPGDTADDTLLYDPNGQFEFLAGGEASGDSFTYTVTDGNGGQSTARVIVNVTGVNDDPVANDDTVPTDEDTLVVFDPTLNDADPDGDPLEVLTISDPANGTVTDNGDGTFDYTPDPGFNGLDDVTYTATDGAGGMDTAIVTFNVAPVNDAPVAEDDTPTTDEDTPVIIRLLDNDSDVDGDTLEIDSFTQPANGTVTDNGDGTVTYTPDPDFNGPDTFSYTINDGSGGSDTATVSVEVNAAAAGPVDGLDSGELMEPGYTDLQGDQIDGSDGDDDTIFGNGGDDSIDGGAGNDTVDGGGGDDFFEIRDEGDGIDNDIVFGGETSETDGDILTTRGINDDLELTMSAPEEGTLTDGVDTTVFKEIEIIKLGGGNDTVTGSDGDDSIDSGDGNDFINGGDGDDTLDGDEDNDTLIGGNGNDSIRGDEGNDLIDTSGGGTDPLPDRGFGEYGPFSAIPADADPNDDRDTAHGGDGNDTITTGDDADIISGGEGEDVIDAGPDDDTVRGNDDEDLIIGGEGSDDLSGQSGNDTIFGGLGPSAPDALSIPDAPDSGLFGPDPDPTNGMDTIDGGAGRDLIFGEDDDDVITGGYGDDTIDGGIDDDMLSGEQGNDDLVGGQGADTMSGGDDRDSFVIDERAHGFGDVIDGGTGDTGEGDVDTLDLTGLGPTEIVGQTTDADGDSTSGTINFLNSAGGIDGSLSFAEIETILRDNAEPDAVDDNAIVGEDDATSTTIDLTNNDTDPDALDDLEITSIDTTGTTGSVTINPDNDTVEYDPNGQFEALADGETANDSFSYTITDGDGGQSTATVNVTINGVNDAPDAMDDVASTNEETPVTIDVLANDTDVDGDVLTITGASVPAAQGTVSIVSDELVYTPATDFTGTATISYSISDGNGGTDVAEVEVMVNNINDAPTANDDIASTDEDVPVVVDLTGNDTDPDGDPLTVTSVSVDPAEGTVVDNGDGTATFTPAPNFNGPATITYSITDGNGGSDTGEALVSVGAAQDAPVANDDAVTTDEDTPVTIDVLANDSDPDGDPLTIVGAMADPAEGTVAIVGNELVFTPAADFNGTATLSYTISDGNGGTDSADVTVTVDPVNDAPIAVDDIETTDEDVPVVVDLLGNDVDPDGDPLAISSLDVDPAEGSVVDNGDGTVTFTPAPDFNGPATITYTVTDGNGGSDTGEAVVSVGAVNDAPIANDDTGNTDQGTPVTVDVIANDSDPDGDPIEVISATVPVSQGTVVNNNDGTVTFTPAPAFVGTAVVTYTISDGNGLTDTADVTIEVADVVGPVDGLDSGEDMDPGYTDLQGDMIDGSDGDDDTIFGNDGNDTIDSGVGDDTVDGGSGDDVFEINEEGDGIDNDVIIGGETGEDEGDTIDTSDIDDDLEVIFTDPEEGTIDDGTDTTEFEEIENIILGDGDDTVEGSDGDENVSTGGGSDTVDGDDGDDFIDTSAGGIPLPDRGFDGYGPVPAIPMDADPNDDRDTVDGGAGNDTIITGDDDDFIRGGDGNDVIDAGLDDDTVRAGDDDDLIIGGEGSDLLAGQDGDDTIYGGLGPSVPDGANIPDDGSGPFGPDPDPTNGMDTIDGGEGNDLIFGEDDDDVITAGEGNDTVDGGIDDDSIRGQDGDDVLIGGQGDDTVLGGNGNDIIEGGEGVDDLQGRADRDEFIINDREDAYGDTVDGGTGDTGEGDVDTLDLTGLGPLRIVNETTDADGDSTSGTVEFLDGIGGPVVGSMEFREIENLIPCFTPGTVIATRSGERLVEDLQVGDRVITRDNGLQEIRWIGRRDLKGPELIRAPHLRPVLIRAGSLGQGLPLRDMLVSPQHRMLINNSETALYFEDREVLAAAKHLTGFDGVDSVEASDVSYIHIMFDQHEVVLSNGSWSESFQPGDQILDGMGDAQRDEIFDLFPELRNTEGLKAYQAARRSLKKHEAKLIAAL